MNLNEAFYILHCLVSKEPGFFCLSFKVLIFGGYFVVTDCWEIMLLLRGRGGEAEEDISNHDRERGACLGMLRYSVSSIISPQHRRLCSVVWDTPAPPLDAGLWQRHSQHSASISLAPGQRQSQPPLTIIIKSRTRKKNLNVQQVVCDSSGRDKKHIIFLVILSLPWPHYSISK